MAQNFKETAHLKTNLEAYGANYDRIFRKHSKDCDCPACLDVLNQNNSQTLPPLPDSDLPLDHKSES